ncbi:MULTISPECIES: lytic transglycosylase domain-containing protein [unclassified Bradyrhizobium]|uniref:lytic transglycosylase domain-containing protein n=1 Tax=unclassified Bradyrhizobium TaxID=2631580 RepID=UPI0028ECE94E|nr:MULTISPECIES: lytic transglycosylase domain-containing protein [unclassified Bradyrhizobium]
MEWNLGGFIVTATRPLACIRLVRTITLVATVVVWSTRWIVSADAAACASQPAFEAHQRTGPAVSSFTSFVTEAAQRFGIPERWIYAVMRAESGGERRMRSPKGAMGLMQIMPETWRDMRARLGLGADPYDPRDNILAGVAYLREMHDRYGMPGFLAAYNAGPRRYERHLATGWPLPMETRDYVARLAPIIGGRPAERAAKANAFAPVESRATLFIPRSRRRWGNDRRAPSNRSNGSSGAHATADPSALAQRSGALFVRRAVDDLSQ